MQTCFYRLARTCNLSAVSETLVCLLLSFVGGMGLGEIGRGGNRVAVATVAAEFSIVRLHASES